MALSFAQPQVERPGPVGAPPCRSLQPLRSGQPAARVGPFQLSSPAPASTRKKVVATASRREGACNRAGEPSEPFFGEEPRRNEQGPGNLLPGPSGWSPRRRSYLSFHDCAAWSFPSGQKSLRYGSLFAAAPLPFFCHWQRAATLCRQHPVLACRHGKYIVPKATERKHP